MRGNRRDEHRDYTQAPVGRSLVYMAIGLVVAIWAFASIVG